MVKALICFALLALIGCAPQPAAQTVEPVPCVEGESALPAYTPSLATGYVTLQDRQFFLNDAPFRSRGVNYYPSRYPWRRFLTEADMDTVRDELLLLRVSGMNTLRLFLWNAALFNCEGQGTTPNIEAFARFDETIHEAAAQGFRLIVTLNDLPDDALYTNTDYTQAQTRLIVERYRDEPAILAWDLRNEGDIDYGSNDTLGRGKVPRDDVLNWLATISEQVNTLDPNHLITAGWLHDSGATAAYVDFLSFHHWDDARKLRERIAGLRAPGKPILLEEFGYSTFRVSPEEQSRLIAEAVQVADEENLLGWLIWTAFDFPLDATCVPPACPSQDNAEHHFGLWYPDYTPKPAVQMLLNR